MDSDQGKLFIGGISWETTEEKLRDYFKSYGEVAETVIMKDRATGRARGFGFVIFADPTVADRVVLEKHTIDGRTVCETPSIWARGLSHVCVCEISMCNVMCGKVVVIGRNECRKGGTGGKGGEEGGGVGEGGQVLGKKAVYVS